MRLQVLHNLPLAPSSTFPQLSPLDHALAVAARVSAPCGLAMKYRYLSASEVGPMKITKELLKSKAGIPLRFRVRRHSYFHFLPWQVGAGDLVHNHQGWVHRQDHAQVPGCTFDLCLKPH